MGTGLRLTSAGATGAELGSFLPTVRLLPQGRAAGLEFRPRGVPASAGGMGRGEGGSFGPTPLSLQLSMP